MRKITTKSEANEFYKVVNDHIDDYITNWKIDPRNLKKYFANKKKREQFLSRTGLNDVERINTILDDILDDRDAMSRDSILKFESFFVKESLNIETASFNHEKVLADLFRTSLSHIEIKDKEKNHFVIDDMSEKVEVSIFSSEDLDKFKKGLKELLVEEAKEVDLDFYQIKVESRNLKTKVSLPLSEVIDKEKFENKLDDILSEKKVLSIITNWLNSPELLRSGKRFEYFKSTHNHFVWKVVKR
jgi:hypothetical protein